MLIKMTLNLTQTPEGVCSLLQLNSSVQGLHVIRLIHLLKGVDVRSESSVRAMHYLPWILCNVTQNADGRQLIIEPQRNLLRYIMPFLDADFDYELQSDNSETESSKNRVSIGE